MDITSAIFIGFLCGYIVFREIMTAKHIQRLEEMISKGKVEYVNAGAPIDPGSKEVTMAKPDTTVPIDEAPNPFATGTPRGEVAL